MNYLKIKLLALFILVSLPILFAQDDKMDWWREARFGMFIHWGVYSVYGNVYDGINVTGEQIHYDRRGTGSPAEWIMNMAMIPRSVYREAAKEFDANEYDPKKWVEIAKNAGMKYIVITAKHHDGFCLFETKYTNWNAIDASAAKRDLLKELVSEAKKAGLKIGFYYSQNLDWMAEGGMGAVPELNGKEYPLEKVEAYVTNQVIPQITELTTNYDIDLFWFDFPGVNNSNASISKRILDTLLNSPIGKKVIYNDRLYKGFEGDFSTPESDTPEIPYNGYSDNRNREACASLNNSWGYQFESESFWQANKWKTPLYTISRILELTSKGVNFLLNVGPDCHGNIPEQAVNTLHEVGEWMKIYGETIYKTQKNELRNPFEYGYVTQRNETNGNVHWYLHVSPTYWAEKEIILPGVLDLPQSAVLFETKEPLKVKLQDHNLVITLPDNCPNPYYSTLDLHFSGAPKQMAKSGIRNEAVRLTPFQASTLSISKDYIPYVFKCGGNPVEITYTLFLEAGKYTLEAEYAAWINGGEIHFIIENKQYTGAYQGTGDPNTDNDLSHFIIDNLGGVKIEIPESKVYSLTIKRYTPEVLSWIDIRRFTLLRIPGTSINSIRKVLIYPTDIKNGYFICESPAEQTVRIYDTIGKLCKTSVIKEYTKIDVNNFKPGIYIVKGEAFAQRIIIQ
jgi:alpha-L-fucosidase